MGANQNWYSYWSYAKVADFELLDGYYKTEEEESLAEAEGRYIVGVAKRVVAFTNFMYCWNNEFPNMKTQGRVGKGMFIGERYEVGSGTEIVDGSES